VCLKLKKTDLINSHQAGKSMIMIMIMIVLRLNIFLFDLINSHQAEEMIDYILVGTGF
jgi:hypothetical protein